MGRKKRVRATDPITCVTFSLTNSGYPFVGASAVESCEMTLEEIIPRGESRYAEFFSVDDADPETILELAAEHGDVDAQLFDQPGNSDLFEFVVAENCPAVYLGEQGALPREVYGKDGEGRIAAEIPHTEDPDAIIERFLDDHPDAELVDVETSSVVRPLFAHRESQQVIEEHLDERQREILEAAHEAGYYDWPRETSADELADELDTDLETLRQRLRQIEQLLIVASDGPASQCGDDSVAQSS